MSTLDTLIPVPQRVRAGKGSFALPAQACILHPSAAELPAIKRIVRSLGMRLHRDPACREAGAIVGRPHGDSAPPAHPEGYALDISRDGVELAGADLDGLYWGLTTLQQLAADSGRVPACRIQDWPAFAVRGHHDDISRKQVSSLADFKQIVRLLSQYKINSYFLYIEDTLHLKSYPDVGRGRGKLTPREVQAIVAEGAKYNVTIIPSFTCIGHHENMLSNPKFARLGRKVFHCMSSLDPDKPSVRAFLRKAIADVCALFPGPYFNMCFDETQGVTEEAYFKHANWCAEQIVAHGKTPVMWVDMIYNHFGFDALTKLHPAIIPINWYYGDTTKGVRHHKELVAQGRDVWGFGSHNTHCRFVPDYAEVRDHYAGWMRQLQRVDGTAFIASTWCDDGGENQRNMAWNLIAAFGEYAWSGKRADAATQEARFEHSFYGVRLPKLERLVKEFPSSLSLDMRTFWQLHRQNAWSFLRRAAAEPTGQRAAAADEKKIQRALVTVADCKAKAHTRAGYLDHISVGLRMILSVVHRRQAAHAMLADHTPAAIKREARAVMGELRSVRAAYQELWLRHNKRPNIEVSLGVFDRMIASYEAIARPARLTADENARFVPLDLGNAYNVMFADVAGIPCGLARVNDVPFEFADVLHTHVALTRDAPALDIECEPARACDLHLLVTCGTHPENGRRPALRVELFCQGTRVYCETLRALTHMVNWWAPRGEHMWAGGGLAHADARRVRFGLEPARYFGILHVSDFALQNREVDQLRLTALSDDEVQVFAATVERKG
jgi:hypothetical protein